MSTNMNYLKTITDLLAERMKYDEAILKLTALFLGERGSMIHEPDAKQVSTSGAYPSVPQPVKRLQAIPESETFEEQTRPGFKGMVLWKAAEKLLQMEGHPMGVTDMVEALRRGGLDHRSKNLYSNLQQAMKARPDRFKCISHGVFDLNHEVDRTLKAFD